MTFKNQAPKVSTTWIVVADRAQARILSKENNDNRLKEVATLDHPKSAMKQSDYVSDHQGRAIGHGGVPVAFDAKTDWEHKNAAEFAKQVADYLETGRNKHQFGRVVLMAAPAFLGALRPALSALLTAIVDLEVSKDYTDCSLDEIAAHLEKQAAAKPV